MKTFNYHSAKDVKEASKLASPSSVFLAGGLTTNPLGVKGCGEAGTIAATPTVMNAVINALGGREISLPATAEKVWKACKDNKKSNAEAA